MKLNMKFLLSLLAVVSLNNLILADDREDDRDYQDRRRKVCKCCSLIVSGNGSFGGNLTVSGSETVGGNLSVTGSITGGSFAVSPLAASLVTGAGPGVPGIGGALAWGEVGNTTGAVAVLTGAFFPMNYASTSFANVLETATSTPATDGITLTSAGIYLMFYQATQATVSTISQIQLTSSTVAIPNTTVTSTTAALNALQLTGFVITSQPAGAFIQLKNSGATTITTPANPNVGAKLTVIRIA